jgi:hypothetical protein
LRIFPRVINAGIIASRRPTRITISHHWNWFRINLKISWIRKSRSAKTTSMILANPGSSGELLIALNSAMSTKF